MNPVRQTVSTLVAKSKHVDINESALRLFAQNYAPVSHPPYLLPNVKLDEQLNFLLLIGSLAFSFWGDPKWKIIYQNRLLDGYDAMNGALLRAIENGENVTDAKVLKQMTRRQFEKIVAGEGKIPLVAERLAIVHELGEKLEPECSGKFSNLIARARGSCIRLVDLLISTFPTLEDKSVYEGEAVYFRKRAQLIVYDLTRSIPKIKFDDLNDLTVFSDYKIPQVLRDLRIIEYSPILTNSVDQQLPIPPKSEDETEIRMNTVWVVELLVEQLRKRGIKTNAAEVGTDLWHLSRVRKLSSPYHRTRTYAY